MGTAGIWLRGKPNTYEGSGVKRKYHPLHSFVELQQKRGSSVGTFLVALCCGDHASGISDGSRTESTSGGCTQHVFGLRRQPISKGRRGCTEASRSSAWPDAHSFPQSRPFNLAGSSHDGMSRWCVLGCGADADRYGPGRFRWAGECVASGTSVSHRAYQVAGLWPCNTFGTGRKAMSPFPLPPSSDSAGSFQERSHG